MSENHLPKNWQEWPLADVGTWFGGGTPSKSKEQFWKGSIPWVSPKDMKALTIFDTKDHISEEAVEHSAAKLIPGGAVLFVTRSGILAHSFPVATTKSKVAINQDLKAIIPKSVIDPEYLGWCLRVYARLILDRCTKDGTTVHSIEVPSLQSFRIPIPPLNEQHRIVAKIEELFSELDKGVESLKAAREQLKVYRQAVLKHAFEGKLTAQWREENKDKLESPEQLLARIKEEREARYQQQLVDWEVAVKDWEANGKKGKKPPKPRTPLSIETVGDEEKLYLPRLPKNWMWMRFEHIAEISGGITKNPKRNALPRRMRYLRVANVYADKLLLSDINEIGVTDEEFRKVALEPGDLLVVEGNGSIDQIGRVAVWGGEILDCGHQNHLIRVRMTTSSNPKFFLKFLLSPLGRDLIVKEASSTSGLHTLSISKVGNLTIPVTSPSEETEILKNLDEKLSNVEKVLDEIDIQLQHSETLRQSILRKAFSGQLVSQDPNDEPASVLLERIKAEKAADVTRTRKARKAEA